MDWAEHGRKVHLTALHRLSQGWVPAVLRQNLKGARGRSQRPFLLTEVTFTSCREVEVVALGATGVSPTSRRRERWKTYTYYQITEALGLGSRESMTCLLYRLGNQAHVQKDKRLHLPALLVRGIIQHCLHRFDTSFNARLAFPTGTVAMSLYRSRRIVSPCLCGGYSDCSSLLQGESWVFYPYDSFHLSPNLLGSPVVDRPQVRLLSSPTVD